MDSFNFSQVLNLSRPCIILYMTQKKTFIYDDDDDKRFNNSELHLHISNFSLPPYICGLVSTCSNDKCTKLNDQITIPNDALEI